MVTVLIIAVFVFLIIKTSSNMQNKEVTGKLLQLLETSHILCTTVNLEVLESRISFAFQLLKKIGSNKHLDECSKKAITSYLSVYPGNQVPAIYYQLINDPDKINRDVFSNECRIAFFIRYCEKMIAEANELKTSKAKERRIIKSQEMMELVVSNLRGYDVSPYVSVMSEKINDMYMAIGIDNGYLAST